MSSSVSSCNGLSNTDLATAVIVAVDAIVDIVVFINGVTDLQDLGVWEEARIQDWVSESRLESGDLRALSP